MLCSTKITSENWVNKVASSPSKKVKRPDSAPADADRFYSLTEISARLGIALPLSEGQSKASGGLGEAINGLLKKSDRVNRK